MQAYFNINLEKDESIGILMCKLKRTNADELDEDETTFIQFAIF
jgi:hypothetical protein